MAMNALLYSDLWQSIKNVIKNGGAVFTDIVPAGTANATAAGTGTTRTSISTTYIVPNGAVEMLAIAPFVAPTAQAAADSLIAVVDVQGTSFKKQPQQVIAPIGSVSLSVGCMRTTPVEWYTVRAPVTNGDQYDWGVQPLIANSHNFKAGVCVMYATAPSGDPIIYSQCQTTINAFKAVGANSGGTLQLTAANGLYEVATGLSPESVNVAQENTILTTSFNCGALDPLQTFAYVQDPPATIGATSGDSQEMQISRYMPMGLRFKVTNPTITFTDILDVATTNNIGTTHMVRYTSF